MKRFKKSLILFSITLKFLCACAQNDSQSYEELIKTSYSLYLSKDYYKSALSYSKAFGLKSGNENTLDRYNAACAWALCDRSDSAFYHLNVTVKKFRYDNYDQIINDRDLNSLHGDPQWSEVLRFVNFNKDDLQKHYKMQLVLELDSIYEMDQKFRRQFEPTYIQYGAKSKQMQTLIQMMNKTDSLNLIKVESILERHGWLGTDKIGEKGNSTLFLVFNIRICKE
jgi:hypothetical protein